MTADLVDAARYLSISDRYGVTGVPAIFANGRDGLVWAVPERELFKWVRPAVET